MAGMVVEEMVADPDCSVVCIREIQKSLDKSAKKLIEAKIIQFKVSHLFVITKTEIRRVSGSGVCIFVGMQDHTAESVKSLEGFHIAWVEEAESLSDWSLKLLRPTIRTGRPWANRDAEIWFSWNPKRRNSPVDKLLRQTKRANAIVVKALYTDNPWCPESMFSEAAEDKALDEAAYEHVWLGGYETASSKNVINLLWIESAIGLAEDMGIEITGATMTGLDVAGAEDGGDDNALAGRKGIELFHLEKWNGLDTSATTSRAISSSRLIGATACYYDATSVGEGVTGAWGDLKRRDEVPENLEFHPWLGGSSVVDPNKKVDEDNPNSPLNKDQYDNLKAQGWFSLRRRFINAHKCRLGLPYDPDHMISIRRDLPFLEEVKQDLSQPQHKAGGRGKTVVDKQPDHTPSPNVGDSIMQAYFPVETAQPNVMMFL